MEWEKVFQLFIATLPATLTAVAAVITALRTSAKVDAAALKIDNTDSKLDYNTNITAATKREIDAVAQTAKNEATKVAETAVEVAKNVASEASIAVDKVTKAINGRLDERIEEAKKAGYSEGLLAGQMLQERIERHTKANREHQELVQRQLDELRLLITPVVTKLTEDQ